MAEARFRITASDETGRAFQSARAGLSGVAKSASAVSAALSAVSAGAIVALVKNVADAGDKIQKLSIRLGASTEALSQYRLVAERSGVAFETLTNAWQKLNTRAAEAAAGQGEARDAFRELGIQVEAFAKLSPEQKFEALADAMQGVSDAGRRQYLAQKLMEEGGVSLLQVMDGGSESIRAMRQEADSMGLTFSRVQADQLAKFNDQLTNAAKAAQGAAQQLVVSLGPTVIELARAFTVATSELSKFIDGFRALENRSNVDGLRQRLTELNEAAVDLAGQIDIVNRSGGDASLLERRLAGYRDEITATIQRLRDLQKESAAATGGNIADFNVNAGAPLPSLADDKAAAAEQKAAQRAAEAAAKEQERLRAQFEQRLEIVRDFAASESEILTNNYLDRVFVIEEAVQNEILNQQEANRLKLELESKYQYDLKKITEKGLTDRQKFERLNRTAQARELSNHLTNMLADVGQHNKAMFAIYKVSAIAQAVIAAHEGASKTLGAYPYPVNVALAALSYAAGVARVAAIASTNFGATSAGGGGSSGGGSVGTYPVDPVIGLPERPQERAQTVQDVTINIGDSAIFPASAVRALIEQINEQAADGVLIGSIRVA